MLISPPFILDRAADESDADYLQRAMPPSAVSRDGVPEGSYPVSAVGGWHGGLHLQAPVTGEKRLPVVAIANGRIVCARKPTKPNDTPSPQEGRNYNPFGHDPAWTDDGLLIIKHNFKMGSGDTVFYSLYTHLSQFSKAFKEGDTVKRKDVLGESGKVYGAKHQLHIEILCDDDNLKRLTGRNTGDGNSDTDGRKDLVFGEIYFRLPVGTKFYSERPDYDTVEPTAAPAHTLAGNSLYVGIDYARGDQDEGNRGLARLTTYKIDGNVLETPVTESNGEYGLYQMALDIRGAYEQAGKNAAPANTGGDNNEDGQTSATLALPEARTLYELLRFGRVIGPKALTPANIPHWRKVRYPGGEGWVNLNATGIYKSSDADFPAWRGWKFADDDVDGDSCCNSNIIKAIAKAASPDGAAENGMNADPKDGPSALQLTNNKNYSPDPSRPTTRQYVNALITKNTVREALEKAICKLPSEWNKDKAEDRLKWLLTDKEHKLEEKDFRELVAHAEALATDWSQEKIGLDSTHWHIHPRQFMRLFRSFCVWPDIIRRWQEAEDNHRLPDDDGLDDFGKTALYEYGLRASLAAIRDHQDHKDFAALKALDKIADNKAVIFGMRVHTDINANNGRGLWDDRVTLLRRDNTGLVELIHRDRYTTEPSGRYLDGGQYGTSPQQGPNVGGTPHKDIGRLIAERTYEYAPYYRPNNAFGAARFGNNQFNILRKTVPSQVERLVTDATTFPQGEHVSEGNAHWQTGTAAGYSEGQSMHFHKGYGTSTASSSGIYGMTGSAGCQTFPYDGEGTFDNFMNKLEPLKAGDRFQYVLKYIGA